MSSTYDPNGQYSNQIDFILTSKRFKSGIFTNKTGTFPEADVGSDHDLVMTWKTKNKKQPWISNKALDLCDKRREKKGKQRQRSTATQTKM